MSETQKPNPTNPGLDESLRPIIDLISDPVVLKNERLEWTFVNQAFCDFMGAERTTLLGHTDAEFFASDDAAAFELLDRRAFETGEPSTHEAIVTSSSDAGSRVVRATRTLVEDADGSRTLITVLTDLTALRTLQRERDEANERLTRLAMFDELTGLPNRRALIDELDRTVALCLRHSFSFSVLCCDIDGFLQVNEEHGEQAADEVARCVAVRLKGLIRESDYCARIGENEFVVIGKNACTAGAGILAHRISMELSRPIALSCAQVEVSTHIGVACYPGDAKTRSELVQAAELATYHAKRVTRAPVAFFESVPSDADTEGASSNAA